jgi:hypothetical protein
MAYVPAPKDLSKISTKLALGLSKRQLICFGLAAAVGVPAYLLTRNVIGGNMAVLLMIVLMLPFFFFAMYERDGLPAEKILRNFLRAKLWPSVRPYKTANLYKYLEKEGGAIAGQTQSGKAKTRKTKKKRR